MFDTEKVKDRLVIAVLVQFATDTAAIVQGEFKGEFKRLPQERIDHLLDSEENYRVSEVIDEILVGVSGIGKGGTEMPAAEQLEWVKATPECVQAAYTAFFRAMRPERYNEKTSRRARGRG